MWIRYALGAICMGAGVLFLAINSVLLSRGAAKWGLSYWEQISYGSVAATVPWIIAIMPFLIALSIKRGKRFARPSLLTLVGCSIWLVFVSYNLAGAASAVATVREEVVSMRQHAASTVAAREAERKRLLAEYEAIPKHRPASVLEPLLAARKTAQMWESTEQCTDIRRGREKKFCDEVVALSTELGAARRADEINARLLQLDARLEASAPAALHADPEARFISRLTGWDEAWVSENLPVKTPIVLELGSMTLIYFGLFLFGVSHRAISEAPRLAEQSPATILAGRSTTGLQEPRRAILPPPPPATTITRQRELCEWFFRHCSRPIENGSLPEADWYRHYTEVCRQSADEPLPLAAFRRIAERYVPSITTIDGVTYYRRVLPYTPGRAA